jgi:hypothetical protein
MRDLQAELITLLLVALAFGLVMMATCESTTIDTLDVYDVDDSGDLSADELIRAENDYVSGRLTESDYRMIMRLAVTPTLTDEGVMLPPPEEIATPEPIIAEPVPTPTPTPTAIPEEPPVGKGAFAAAVGLLIGAGISLVVLLLRRSKN